MNEWVWDRLPDRPVRRLTLGATSSAVTVVVVPGLGAPGYLLPFTRACAEWARVHLLDLPGFGHRRTSRCPATLHDVADVLAGATFPPERRTVTALVPPVCRSLRREPLRELAAVAPYYLRGRRRVWTLLTSALRDAPEDVVRRAPLPTVVVRGDRDPFTHPVHASEWLRSTSARLLGPFRAG